MNNEADFDPLHCSPADGADMVAGYLDGWSGKPPPRITSRAYDHGRRNATNDRAGVAEPDQRELARRYLHERVH